MSLSIDAHNAVAPAILPQSKISDADTSDQAASESTQDSASSAKTGAGAAYTIATSATSATSVTRQALSGVQDDLTGDGARLMALQVRQALSSYSGSIANPSSHAILSLFRN